MAHILVIDDEPIVRDVICERARQMGHTFEAVGTLEQGKALSASVPFDLVFLDVRLPDGNGLNAISAIKAAPSSPEVVIITGVADDHGAKMAVDSGAWDYLQKPLDMSEITLQIKRTLEYRDKSDRDEPGGVAIDRGRIIGHSRKISQCLMQVGYCAASDVNVLIQGETGTGKELFARNIHENSPRKDGPFVVVDCASLPEHLVESVLFGHVKGAFTGADQAREGLVKQADQGTLFLDEVGELPLGLQKSFLRVLQERMFRPVGGRREVMSRFRLISATNRDLNAMAAKGLFRKDLLYRLQTTIIGLPALRERKEDIKFLMFHYVHGICDQQGMETKGFVPEFLEVLEKYDWPGNVRELVNTLEHAVISGNSNPTLYPANLPSEMRIRYIRRTAEEKQKKEQKVHEAGPVVAVDNGMVELPHDLPPYRESREDVLRRFEAAYVTRLMNEARGDLNAAMAISGMSRTQLYALLKKHAVTRGAADPSIPSA